jgi:Ca2+-binding RTX toxin-like protein
LRTTIAFLVLGLSLAVAGPALAEPSAVVRWYGDSSSATGAALGQGPCDVNGDDYDDVVVGAWFWDKAPNSNIGATYVLLGGPDVQGGDLNLPGDVGAVRIDGPNTANAFTGFGVACLGDTNGDGLDDLGISYYVAEKAYVVLGDEEFGSVDLTNLGEQGYELQGDETDTLDYNVGFSLAAAGDVNDDGLGDIAIAGVVADTQSRTNNGRVWVVAGKEDVANVDLIEPDDGDVLVTIDGRGSEDRLGQIAPAGDVNGDGVDDFVLGAYTSTPWGSGVAVPGQAWVIWGDGPATVDLANVGSAGFTILGPQRQRDRLGISVSGAGDVNGDGKADVLLGGDGVYNAATGERPGSAWVVFGSDSTSPVYTATATDPAVYTCAAETSPGVCDGAPTARGYWIQGADSSAGTGSESTGYSLAGIGDVSGDEIPDFAIGAYGYDPTAGAGAGAVWVVYGKTSTSTQALASLTAEQGYRIDGLVGGDRFGRQVASLGDIDGNGVDDFAGGGDFSQRPLAPGTPRTQAGEVALALLGPLTTETTLDLSDDGPLAIADDVDLTATVTRAVGAEAAGAGTVTFLADGEELCTDVAVAAGSASCDDVTFDARGAVELTAEFTGDATLADSTSTAAELLVTEGSVTALESSLNPVDAGAEVTFTASVEGATTEAPADGGTVDFSVDGCDEQPVAAGQATCTTTFPVSGTFAVTATYGGVEDLTGSTSEPVQQVVDAVCDGTTATVDLSQAETPTAGADRIAGTVEADDVAALAGVDHVCGRNGGDDLAGGLGDDTLFGDTGFDTLVGGNGNDRLFGGAGQDDLTGGPGADRLYGGDGPDVLRGGPGADVIRCGGGRDTVVATAGDQVAPDCEVVRR